MSKTVKEHMQDSDTVKKIIEDANALVGRLQKELNCARETMEKLTPYQHPLHRMDQPYHLRSERGNDPSAPASVIAAQVARINTLLGDRA